MADERQFMRLLTEITEIARANGNFITTEDINDYFEELELNDTQKEAIYDYLCKGHITVKGYIGAGTSDRIEIGPGEGKSSVNPVENAESRYINDGTARTTEYRKRVRDLDSKREIELSEIHIRLSEYENETVIEETIHAYLPVVINIASKYANRGVHVDELIQEGNLALTMIVKELAGKTDVTDHEKLIRNRIRESMIGIIDAELENEGNLAAAMGKASLVYEASKQLAESMGKVATLHELSEFTHIPEEEIEDIVKFSGYAIKYNKKD